jgi:hypothetical protein
MAQRETLSTRVARLEELHADLAKKVDILLDAQIRATREAAERDRITDERIGKLVIAIGELISHIPPIPPKAD